MMDDGYWESLLRDAERETEATHPHVEADEATSGWSGQAGSSAKVRIIFGSGPEGDGDWERAEALMAEGAPVAVRVTGYNRGGLLVEFGVIQGFVPASHLVTVPAGQTPQQRATALAAHIGESLDVKVVEIDRSRCRLVLSERLTREDGRAETLLASLQPGQVLGGQVTSLCPFGAFVDLGGFEGLVHISELSWGRVGAPSEVVSPGQQLELLVLEVHADEQRVALSLKRLRPDPWAGVDDRFFSGQVVDATITNVVNFGAFARLEEGLEGLIHVSELAEGTFMHPRNVIQEGDRVRARVLQVDGAKRRIALTLRGMDGRATPDSPLEM